jgi:hypothetical protein
MHLDPGGGGFWSPPAPLHHALKYDRIFLTSEAADPPAGRCAEHVDSLGNITGTWPVTTASTLPLKQEASSAITPDTSLPSDSVDTSSTAPCPEVPGEEKKPRGEKLTPSVIIERGSFPAAAKKLTPVSSPVVLTMEMGGEAEKDVASPRISGNGGGGVDYRQTLRQSTTQGLWQKVSELKSRGKGASKDVVLQTFRELEKEAQDSADPSLKLLCTRFRSRAERAMGSPPQKPASPDAVPVSSDSSMTALDAVFLDTERPYLGEGIWELMASEISQNGWAPGHEHMEMLKARMTVPTGTAGHSIVDGDKDYRGGLKVLKALKEKDAGTLEGVMFPDSKGNMVPLAQALADKIIADPQALSLIGAIHAHKENTLWDRGDLVRDFYDIAGSDPTLASMLLDRVSRESSGGIDAMSREGIMALALLMALNTGKEEEGALRRTLSKLKNFFGGRSAPPPEEEAALNKILSKPLMQRQENDTVRTLLNMRRHEAEKELSARLLSADTPPGEALKIMADMFQLAFCAAPASTGMQKFCAPYLPAIGEGLQKIRGSEEYPALVEKLLKSTEKGRAGAAQMGSMSLSDIAGLQLLLTIGQQDRAVMERIKPMMEPEVRKVYPKGQNGPVSEFLLEQYKKDSIAESLQKLQSDVLPRTTRLGLLQRNRDISDGQGFSLEERQAIQAETLDAFRAGLAHTPGLEELLARYNDHQTLLKVYRRLGPGAEDDQDIAAAWSALKHRLDLKDETIRKLETPGLPRSERTALLDDNCEASRVFETPEFNRIKKDSLIACCRGIAANTSSGLADLPSHFSDPLKAIKVYRTLAPGAEQDSEIALEWGKFRMILDSLGGEEKLKDAIALYCTAKQREARGESWETFMATLIMTGDYHDIIAGGGGPDSAQALAIDDFDDEVSIGGIRLRVNE